MTAPARLRYPGKVALRHALAAANDAGIDIGAIEVAPDGRIRLIDVRAVPKAPVDEFARWEDKL